ncbi:MAG: hypothetical protein RLZZ584_2964 [Pseudomonadota bacterium]
MSTAALSWVSRWRAAAEAWHHARVLIPCTSEQPGPPTLYFHTPDLDRPCGGVLMMYRHVDLLNAAGVRATVLHQRRGFRCSWFEHDTRVTDATAVRIGPADVLVITEPDVDLVCALRTGVRHVVFNQSGHLTWKRSPERVARHYAASPDLAGVITVSAHAAELLRHACAQVDVRHVHPAIDAGLFHPGDGPRSREICYMPRRGGTDAALVLQLLRCRGALDGWQVTPLDGLSHAQVAERLRGARIFLHLPYLEGFGLPAAEAMACGNYVVGYHGYGGREFFRPPSSCAVETGDVLGVARAVEDAIRHDSVDPLWCRERGLAAARHILQTYTAARERRDVLAAYTGLLGLPAGAPLPAGTGAGVH